MHFINGLPVGLFFFVRTGQRYDEIGQCSTRALEWAAENLPAFYAAFQHAIAYPGARQL